VTPMPRGSRPSMATFTWAHAIAAVIEDAPDQQGLGLHADGLVIVQLFAQLGLDRIEQVTIDNGRLLAGQDLSLEDHLPDVETIAEQMSERPAPEWNATDSHSGLQRAHLGDDAAFAQVYHQQFDAAELEIAAEDDDEVVSAIKQPPSDQGLRTISCN
jgi:hypothetical protein